jgi:hypothetical protein
MVSPTRKRESPMARKQRRQLIRDEPPDTGLDTSYDLFDQESKESPWFSIRLPGSLPSKRAFHSSAIINDKYKILSMLT